MTFTEEWFPEESQAALADLVAQTKDVDGSIIEFGSWEARSTVALANACRPEFVHAVDTWEGSPGEESETLAKDRDVYGRFLANIAELTTGNVHPFKMGWRRYMTEHTPERVRLAFIDAEHSYVEVRDQIASLRPLLADGAVICGDDAHHQPVYRAVLEAFPDALRVATLWYWQKPSGTLEDRYRRLCETPSDIVEHLPRFVELVEETNAQHVIELGTRSGVSTIAWLHGLAQTGGHLTSVDISPRPEIGDWPHWTFRQSDDLDPVLLAELEPAEIVFIDTSHLYEHTLAELNVYRHLVKAGGRIVLHDTELLRPENAPPRPIYPVKVAIEEFCDTEGFAWVNNPACWGLGEITL